MSPLFVFATAIAAAIFVRLILLAYIDITMFPAIRYLAPLYPLVMLFSACAFADAAIADRRATPPAVPAG